MGLSSRQFNDDSNSITNSNSKSKFAQLYPIDDPKISRNLLILYSNLTNWCPFLAKFHFLPYFVFPFVKVFPFEPMICFEMTATVLSKFL